MDHNWKNADFGGTRGWFRCDNCGYYEHVTQAKDVPPEQFVPPPADAKLGWPEQPCAELIEAEVEVIATNVMKILEKAGQHNPGCKPSPVVRDAARQRLCALLAHPMLNWLTDNQIEPRLQDRPEEVLLFDPAGRDVTDDFFDKFDEFDTFRIVRRRRLKVDIYMTDRSRLCWDNKRWNYQPAPTGSYLATGG